MEKQFTDDELTRMRERARHHGELVTLLRGLVAAFPGATESPELLAAKRYLSTHCRSCSTALEEGAKRDLCRACAKLLRKPPARRVA